MPPSDSGSQSSKESDSSVNVGSGATMATCGVSSRIKKKVIKDETDEDVCQHRSLGD